MFSGAEIANLKSFDPHVRLVLNGEHTLPIFRGEAGCVEDRNLAGLASESDKPVVRVSGHIDSHQLLVRPGARVNRAAGMGCVGGMLNRCPSSPHNKKHWAGPKRLRHTQTK